MGKLINDLCISLELNISLNTKYYPPKGRIFFEKK